MTWRRWNTKPKEGEQSGTAELSRLSHRLTGRPRARADGLDIQSTLTCGYRFCRTGRTRSIDLRIRRLGVRVPPSAPRSKAPLSRGWGLLPTRLLTAALPGGRYRAGEDVCGFGELVADDVGVHAQCDRGVGVAEPGGDHMHGDASQQQSCRMYVAEIV